MLSLDEARSFVPTYQRLREVQRRLNETLFSTVSPKGVKESARAIDIWRDGGIVFDHQDDVGVLADFAIHDYRASGKNAVERFVGSRAPALDDEDVATVIRGMLAARYTLVGVTEVLDGAGVQVLDLLYGTRMVLIDVSLGEIATPRTVLAARLLPMGGWCMTSGATLPVDAELARLFVVGLGDVSTLLKSEAHRRAQIARMVIRLALADPDDMKAHLQRIPAQSA